MVDVIAVSVVVMTHRIDAVLDGAGAVEFPNGVRHVEGDLLFGFGFGVEALKVAVDEGVVGLEVFIWHDDDLAGEPVTGGVEAGPLFAFRRARACRVLRVFAICDKL